MSSENPATRLLELLNVGRSIAPNMNCRAAWCQVLETDVQATLFGRLASVMKLVSDTKEALDRAYPKAVPSTGHWMTTVTTGFKKQNLLAEWSTFINHIDDHTISYLELTSQLLDAKLSSSSLEGDIVTQHRETLNKLLVEIVDSEHPEKLRKYLTRALQRIIASLDEFKITGGQAVLDAVDAAIGRAVIDTQLGEEVRKSPSGARFAAQLAALTSTFKVEPEITNLSQTITELLAPPLVSSTSSPI